MPPAATAVADSNLQNFEIFKIAAEKSRTSTETFSAMETVDPTRAMETMDPTRDVMAIVAKMAIVTKMQIVANMEIAARMETVETTAGRVVRMPRAARTSARTAILFRPVARRKTVAGDRRPSGTTTSATEIFSTITGSSNVGEFVNRCIF
jgi:hypothetical protein